MDNCVKCNSGSNCLECKPGFYPKGACYKCPSTCLECISEKVCSRCIEGYYLT